MLQLNNINDIRIKHQKKTHPANQQHKLTSHFKNEHSDLIDKSSFHNIPLKHNLHKQSTYKDNSYQLDYMFLKYSTTEIHNNG
jgi:hypothetical protein